MTTTAAAADDNDGAAAAQQQQQPASAAPEEEHSILYASRGSSDSDSGILLVGLGWSSVAGIGGGASYQ